MSTDLEEKEQELMAAFVKRGTIIGLLLLVTYLAESSPVPAK